MVTTGSARTAALLAPLVFLAACGGGEDDDPSMMDGGVGDAAVMDDDAAVVADAGPFVCATPTLRIGTCQDVTESFCGGRETTFVEIDEGDTLNPVIGFQGAPMFVFLLRTDDTLNPGDDYESFPMVNLSMHEDMAPRGTFISRVEFQDIEDGFESYGLFLVVNGPVEPLVGETLHLDAELTDVEGQRKCGTVDFVAGEVL